MLVWAGTAHAAATPRVPDARAYYVVNAANGDVLVAHNARAHVAIASITKLMTVLVALQHLKPDDVVTVTRGAAQVGDERAETAREGPRRADRRSKTCSRGTTSTRS